MFAFSVVTFTFCVVMFIFFVVTFTFGGGHVYFLYCLV